MAKKLTSIIISIAIVLTACSAYFASAAEKEITDPQNLTEYTQMLKQEGYPVLTTEQIMSAVSKLNSAYRFMTGRGGTSQEYFNFNVDEILNDICLQVASETGFDLLLITSRMPETNQLAEFVVDTFDLNTTALREAFYEKRYEMDEQGRSLEAKLYYFLGLYFGVIVECKALCVPEEDDENCYEIVLDITLRDGSVHRVTTGAIVNTETNEIYDRYGNGIVGTGYNFSLSEMLLYTTVTSWTRDFGFCLFYDIFSYTTPFFFYETRRIKFNYDGLDWMIQVWKGNYLVSNGAEVGIYTRDEKRFGSIYDCANDEQMMEMSMELYHGDDLLFSRPKQLHWWLTGFRISDTLYPAGSMTLKFSIEMKNAEMLNAFCKAIENNYRKDMTYTVDGLTVNVVW